MPSDGGRRRVATKRHKPPERLLIVDASLAPKLASRLRERGRAAKSAGELGWKDHEDPDLLRSVFGEYPEAVLVTADDNMPADHPLIIKEVGATIATIEPWDRRPRPPLVLHDGMTADEAWKREVVHRWAHSMATQALREVRRYARDVGGKRWTPRIRNPQGQLFK
jgi:hypothetical protein